MSFTENTLTSELALVKIGADKKPFNPTIASNLTLQLHAYWCKTQKSNSTIRTEQQRLIWNEALPLLREVSNAECQDPETLLKSIVYVCVLLSGLGSPSAPAVMKEALPALRSVLKISDVAKFTELTPNERQQQVVELAQIVMGIRLFNKDCLRGGAGIEDLPELLTQALTASTSRLQLNKAAVTLRCADLTKQLMNPENGDDGSICLMEDKKAALCLLRLYEIYLGELLNDIRGAETDVKICVEQLRETLLQLHETVRYRAAIPTIQVYPLFVQLSVIWRELQCAAAFFSHINSFAQGLHHIVECLGMWEHENDATSSDDSDLEAVPGSCQDIVRACKLRGFCPWTLLKTSGIAIPGHHISNGFAFASKSAMNQWNSSAEHLMNELVTFVKGQQPYLRILLDVNTEDTGKPITETSERIVTPKIDIGIQTEVHPISHYIDKEYSWSEWELKRRALQMARLTRCATTSQQTYWSEFRASTETQTVLPGWDKSTQMS